MARVLIILPSILIFQFVGIWAQLNSEKCPCNDVSTGATWGDMLNSTECRGKCDVAGKIESWNCMIDQNTITVCKRIVPCVKNDTCEGTWAPWANVGECNATCGRGFRPRARTCYKQALIRNATRNVKKRFCLGGKGSYSQQENFPCNITCLKTTMPPPSPSSATTTITSTIKQSSSTAAIETSSFSNGIQITKSSADSVGTHNERQAATKVQDVTQNHDQENASSSNVDVLTLTAILGSVALICLAVIIIALIVVRRRKAAKAKKTKISIGRSIIRVKVDDETECHDYEVLPPALPSRQSIANKSPRSSASNILYDRQDVATLRSSQIHDFGEEEDYLRPECSSTVPSVADEERVLEEEETYEVINEYEK